jgi:hypothetical protein
MIVYNCVIYIWGGFQNKTLKDILLLYIFWSNKSSLLYPWILTLDENERIFQKSKWNNIWRTMRWDGKFKLEKAKGDSIKE